MATRRWPKGTWMKLTSKDTLRALMKQRGLSYADVGRAAGCHKTMISALANGYRPSCTPKLAERIAQCLAVPLEVLFVPNASADSGHIVQRGRKVA
jgi:transcriptional regulator with XRE-family HTH domain